MTPDQLKKLATIVGTSDLLSDPADCWTYGYDNSRRQQAPDAVAFPRSHEVVCQLVKFCNQEKIPLTPRGRGTGTTGASVPIRRGLVMSMERMDRILDIDPANRTMTVEPGVINKAVQDCAGKYGLFWAPDPTSAAFCTIGGNLAYNSAGPRAIKYGTPRENVLGLRAVTGGGEDFRCGVRTTKGVVGYDLTRLLIGSEGTLAIITEAILKLLPLPAAKATMQAVYRDINSAALAISGIMGQPEIPCALELIDAQAINMIRHHSHAKLPEQAAAMLIIEADGSPAALAQAISSIHAAAHNDGLVDFKSATSREESQALWDTRKALSPALRTVAPKKINEDIVVPVSNIPQLISGLEKLAQQFGITIVNFGHAGNGNIHVNLLVDPDDEHQMAQADPCLAQVFDLVLSLNGTLSGEHGVGLEKRDFVAREIGPVALDLMQRIKNQFDPNHILNPDKMLPPIQ